MNFPCPLDAFDDIARLIMGAVFLSCFGAVWCYKTETSKTEPYAAPSTSLQCVCTRRRNCIEQLSPSPKYAPGTAPFPARNSAKIKLIWLILDRGHSKLLISFSM